jgi:hypothetical protein
LVLQALGFDLGEGRLKGDALEAERAYAARLIALFKLPNASDENQNNAAQQAFEAILRERAADPLLNPTAFDPNNFKDEQAYLDFKSSMTVKFQVDSATVREELFNLAADGYTVPDVNGDPKEFPGYEAELDLWLERSGLNVVRPELNFLDSRERIALYSLAYNSKKEPVDNPDTSWNEDGLPTTLGPSLTKVDFRDVFRRMNIAVRVALTKVSGAYGNADIGTKPWMAVGRTMHDCMDAGGRATQEAKAEEQLSSI